MGGSRSILRGSTTRAGSTSPAITPRRASASPPRPRPTATRPATPAAATFTTGDPFFEAMDSRLQRQKAKADEAKQKGKGKSRRKSSGSGRGSSGRISDIDPSTAALIKAGQANTEAFVEALKGIQGPAPDADGGTRTTRNG